MPIPKFDPSEATTPELREMAAIVNNELVRREFPEGFLYVRAEKGERVGYAWFLLRDDILVLAASGGDDFADLGRLDGMCLFEANEWIDEMDAEEPQADGRRISSGKIESVRVPRYVREAASCV